MRTRKPARTVRCPRRSGGRTAVEGAARETARKVAVTVITHVHKIAAEWLRRHARGRAQARPKGQVLRGLGALGLHVDPREFDALMGEMVRAGMAVGSSGKGFFWMASREDFRLATGYIGTRFHPMRLRIKAIEAQERRRFPRPLPLIEEAALVAGWRMVARGHASRKRWRAVL